MAIKIDQAGKGVPDESSSPRHLAFVNQAQEALDPILMRRETWGDDGLAKFTPQEIWEMTGWPDEPTTEMLEEIRTLYERYDRDWKGNIGVLAGRGPIPTLLTFFRPEFCKPTEAPKQIKSLAEIDTEFEEGT